MKTTKTVLQRFDPIAFDEEIWLLNAMSQKGWQLAELHRLRRKFKWDDGVVYRYAMDAQQEMSAHEFNQYRAEFADAGWEYVCSTADFHVFRKPYDPALPDSDYMIYTDASSLRSMKRRVPIPFVFLLWMDYIFVLLDRPSLMGFFCIAGVIAFALCTILRWKHLKRAGAAPKPYRFHLWRWSFTVFLVLSIIGLATMGARPDNFDAFGGLASGRAKGVCSAEFTVKLPDFYGLTLSVDDAQPSPVYTITNEKGKVVDTGVMHSPEDYDKRSVDGFFLPGTYTVTLDWDAAYAPNVQNTIYRTFYLDLSSHSSWLDLTPSANLILLAISDALFLVALFYLYRWRRE